VQIAIAKNACKFHVDRLNDGVTIYLILAKPREAVKLGPVIGKHSTHTRSDALYLLSQQLRRTGTTCVAVRPEYGQPKSKNGNIFQA